MLIIKKIKEKLKNYLFVPKKFFFLRYFKFNNSIIRPYFGTNIFKIGGPYIRNRKLISVFGNNIFNPNIIYAQSYWTSRELKDAAEYSKAYNVPIIFNQNGWYYKGWYKKGWKKKNKELVNIHRKSDYIIYQSKFCKNASKSLNNYETKNKNKILLNCLSSAKSIIRPNDTNYFMLSGVFDIDAYHIISPALLAFKHLAENYNFKKKNIKLIIYGFFTKEAKNEKWYKIVEEYITYLTSTGILEFRGKYNYKDNNNFLDISYALHLKYKDPCPNAVVERIKLGILHIFSNSGGTPEIIRDTGLPINVKNTWSKQVPVNYKILVKKILEIINKKKTLRKKIIKRANELNYKKYIKEHRKIFNQVIKKNKVKF
jgi:hypothetical protein